MHNGSAPMGEVIPLDPRARFEVQLWAILELPPGERDGPLLGLQARAMRWGLSLHEQAQIVSKCMAIVRTIMA